MVGHLEKTERKVMKWFQTIKAKFALFYAITALVLAALYSGCMIYIQLNTEAMLMTSTLDSILMESIDDDLAKGEQPKLDALTELYIENDPIRPIPYQFKNLPEGYSEYIDDEELHVYIKTVNGKRYVLTRLQEDFENWEHQQLMRGIILLGVVMLIAFGIGFWAIRKSFEPLDRLLIETRGLERKLQEGIFDDRLFSGQWENNEIGELAASFQSLTQRLTRLWESERRFASEVSHELRTPLTVIGMSIELLENANNLTDRQKAIVQRAKRTSSRMNELLEVFLNISRGGGNKTGRVATVAEIIEEMLPIWQEEAKAKGLSLIYTDSNEMVWRTGEDVVFPKVSGAKQYNAVLVSALFTNLVMNAIRYTETGGIIVSLSETKVSIEDTGVGISIHDKEHIFDFGYRGSVMENSGKVGYGLGLAIAMRICAILDWQIAMDSIEGKGTIFTITMENPVK